MYDFKPKQQITALQFGDKSEFFLKSFLAYVKELQIQLTVD